MVPFVSATRNRRFAGWWLAPKSARFEQLVVDLVAELAEVAAGRARHMFCLCAWVRYQELLLQR